MKLIKLHQVINPDRLPTLISELWVNRDIIRWAYQKQNLKKNLTYTALTLIGDDKEMSFMETPDEINNLCNFIQGVELVRTKPRSGRELSGEVSRDSSL